MVYRSDELEIRNVYWWNSYNLWDYSDTHMCLFPVLNQGLPEDKVVL